MDVAFGIASLPSGLFVLWYIGLYGSLTAQAKYRGMLARRVRYVGNVSHCSMRTL
jgi:hypothetical protein